jgi:hypothetical protein
MRFVKVSIILLVFILHNVYSYAQADTALEPIPTITEVSLQFIKESNKKIDKYTNRLTSKTEKTLIKLTKWENKIKKLLEKTSPETAQQLFSQGTTSFATMLAKVREGKSLAENYKAKYNEYNDKLATNIKYLETQKAELDNKYIAPLSKAKNKIAELDNTVAETETAEKLIKERKKELLTQAYKVLGKNKYIGKMQAEVFSYAESLQNYKTLFSEPGKAEQKALELLGKIPAVNKFLQQNSMLASLFGSQSIVDNSASLAGLQTREGMNTLIQGRIAAGGPNAAAQVSANMQAAQAELTKLKDKILKQANGNGSSIVEGEDGLPSFKKKDLKSKTFAQRIEIGSNFQFGRPNRLVDSQADIALSAGYKVNNKSIAGFGISYKMDYGSISNFYIKHGGLGLRSFLDYKLKKQFFVSGGYELNFNQSFKTFSELRNANGTKGIGNAWVQSGLVGITKKINFAPKGAGKTKLIKGTKVQLLFDMLYNTHVIPGQMWVFRVGQNF